LCIATFILHRTNLCCIAQLRNLWAARHKLVQFDRYQNAGLSNNVPEIAASAVCTHVRADAE